MSKFVTQREAITNTTDLDFIKRKTDWLIWKELDPVPQWKKYIEVHLIGENEQQPDITIHAYVTTDWLCGNLKITDMEILDGVISYPDFEARMTPKTLEKIVYYCMI